MPRTRTVVGDKARSFCNVIFRLPKFHLIDADLATAIVNFDLQNRQPVSNLFFDLTRQWSSGYLDQEFEQESAVHATLHIVVPENFVLSRFSCALNSFPARADLQNHITIFFRVKKEVSRSHCYESVDEDPYGSH